MKDFDASSVPVHLELHQLTLEEHAMAEALALRGEAGDLCALRDMAAALSALPLKLRMLVLPPAELVQAVAAGDGKTIYENALDFEASNVAELVEMILLYTPPDHEAVPIYLISHPIH